VHRLILTTIIVSLSVDTGHHYEGQKQNQGGAAVEAADDLSPGLEPKTLPEAGEKHSEKVAVAVEMFPGSETSSIEGCEQGPCPCTGPDCNDGGGGGSRGYGIAENL
jgi:hypothetical protein